MKIFTLFFLFSLPLYAQDFLDKSISHKSSSGDYEIDREGVYISCHFITHDYVYLRMTKCEETVSIKATLSLGFLASKYKISSMNPVLIERATGKVFTGGEEIGLASTFYANNQPQKKSFKVEPEKLLIDVKHKIMTIGSF